MRTLALTLAVWLAAAAPTLAQEAEPDIEAQVEVQSEVDAPPPEYERLVTEALEESAAGRWAEARALFTQAHEAYPNARTLRGIGVVSFELRDYVAALRALRAALEDERRPLTDAQRAEAEQVIERARAFVAIYTVDALPEDARLIVDGHPATLEPDGTLLLGVGEHDLTVRLPSHDSDARLTVRGGEEGRLPVVVAALPMTAPEPAAPPPPLEASEPPLAAWVMAIGGGAVALVGGVLLALGLADVARVENASVGTEWSELQASYSRAPVLTGLGAGLLGVGGAVGVGGGVWLAASSGGAEGSAMLRLRGTF